MLSWYINGTYFFDVHPPGGKLILTLFAWVGGYNGTHPFKAPSDTFEGHHGILPIRVGCALLGAALAPLAFACAWTITRRLPAALLAAILVVAEVGTLTLTKFILLDSPLMFFMMATFLAMCRLHHASETSGPFSWAWWSSLLVTGLMLGCVISVKFVGLFMVAVVGLYTAHQLWGLFATKGWLELLCHLLARCIALIVVPAAVYLSFFYVHDVLLYKAVSAGGGEEASLSPEFQMRLQGNLLHDANYTADVTYGNLVSLRNARLAGPYLHSHNLSYPRKKVAGARQQVTGYRAKDHNNFFRLLFPAEDPDVQGQFYSGPPEHISSGDFLRLHHVATNATLAVDKQPAVVVKKHKLVHAEPYIYQDPPQGEENPFLPSTAPEPPLHHAWQVVVEGAAEGVPLKTLDTRFSLINAAYGCALTWSLSKLGKDWADGQEEISCSRNLRAKESQWRIEFNFGPKNTAAAEKASKYHSPLGFWGRFLETHQLMQWTNANLKPEAKDRMSPFLHRPWMWPICYKSQPWYDVQFRIVLLGNPLVIWLHLLLLLTVASFLLRCAYTRRRHPHLTQGRDEARLEYWCRWLVIAYLLHYLPFYTMDRILYYHHYFPALQFSSLLTAVFLGHHIQTLAPQLGFCVSWASVAVIMYTFSLYCYVGYGHPTSIEYHPDNSTYRHVRLLESWHI